MKMYSGRIEYAHHSAYMFSDTNLDKVSKTMEEGLAFYKGNGEPIREAIIEAFCDKCNNAGEYKVYRKHSHLIYKMHKCECGRQYETEKYAINY
jgi:hypothetical protein